MWLGRNYERNDNNNCLDRHEADSSDRKDGDACVDDQLMSRDHLSTGKYN